MSKLSELRKRSKASKELQEQRISRIQSAVTEVVNSSTFALTMLNHMEDEDPKQKQDEFVRNVADKVAAVVTDPKIEFLDTCKARGLSERKITKAVKSINELFNLTESEEYEEQIEAVALYLQKNPLLYEDIALLT